MSGQMKTLLDRLNPMYPMDYAFRDIYMIALQQRKKKVHLKKPTMVFRAGWTALKRQSLRVS